MLKLRIKGKSALFIIGIADARLFVCRMTTMEKDRNLLTYGDPFILRSLASRRSKRFLNLNGPEFSYSIRRIN